MTDYAALFKASVKTTGSDIFERVDKERQIEAITREEDKVLAADMQRALDAAEIAAQAERQRQLAEQKEAQESRLEDARREEEEVAMIRRILIRGNPFLKLEYDKKATINLGL